MSRVLVLASAALLATACLVPKLGTGTSSGSGDGATQASTSGAGGAAEMATGVDCGKDEQSGAVLCLGISSCPMLLVDTERFPGCGFKIHGDAIDLECVCNGASLCPVGVAKSCDDARALIADGNAGVVCSEIANGVCTDLAPNAVAASSSSGTCTSSCQMDCGGDPGCLQLCGC